MLDDRAPALPGKPVGAVTGGIRLLRRLNEAGQPMRVTQLARDLSLNPSTCFNILRTLVAEEVVTFDPSRKVYSLGLGMLRLAGKAVLRESDLVSLRPAMERIAARHQVLVTLWRRAAVDRMVLVMSAEPDAPLGISASIGSRVPMFLGALGRVMAAVSDMPRAELKARFEELRWHKAPPFRRYLQEVEAARAKGWALDAGDYASGILTVSAPVIGRFGGIDHVCSATMFMSQHDDRQVSAIAEEIVALGRSLHLPATRPD